MKAQASPLRLKIVTLQHFAYNSLEHYIESYSLVSEKKCSQVEKFCNRCLKMMNQNKFLHLMNIFLTLNI